MPHFVRLHIAQGAEPMNEQRTPYRSTRCRVHFVLQSQSQFDWRVTRSPWSLLSHPSVPELCTLTRNAQGTALRLYPLGFWLAALARWRHPKIAQTVAPHQPSPARLLPDPAPVKLWALSAFTRILIPWPSRYDYFRTVFWTHCTQCFESQLADR